VRRVFRFVLSLTVFWALTAFGATAQVAPTDRVKRNVVVRAEAASNAAPIGKLEPGEDAVLVRDLPRWYEIQLDDGRSGFVSKTWTEVTGAPLVAAAPPADGWYKVHVIDIGTGLAIFIEGKDFTALYDSGSQDDLADGEDNRVLAYIKAVRPGTKVIDHLVLSHPHKDHLELLPDVFDAYQIRNVWDSGTVNPTMGYCRFLKKVEAEPGVAYHDAIGTGGLHTVTFSGSKCKGAVHIREAAQMTSAPIALGQGATMTILYRDASRHADPNENTVVVRLDLGGKRILLAGDAEAGGRNLPSTAPEAGSIEAQLIACCAADLRADVLVVGHHGSKTSSRTAFLDQIQAKTYIISSGPHPYSTVVLPDDEVVAELQRRGQVFRTDLDDEACENSGAKVGPDNDESPGGCDNVLIAINGSGALTTTYNHIAD